MLRHCMSGAISCRSTAFVAGSNWWSSSGRLSVLTSFHFLDGDGLVGQVGDVFGDQVDGRLERLQVGLLESGFGQPDAGLEDMLRSDLVCFGSAGW